MALNPQYEVIGKGFVQQYYAMFDDPAQRPNLINMYNVSPGCSELHLINNVPFISGKSYDASLADRIILHDI